MSRRKWFLLIATILFIGVDVGILVWWFSRTSYSEPTLSFDGSSDQLEHTVIVPTLDTPIPEGKNAIWCASFQIAWNKLKDDVAKGPVQIKGAEEIADRLNKSPVTEADLPEGSYYAAAGLVKDGIEDRIYREFAQRFPGEPPPRLTGTGAARAFGFLKAGMHYRHEFLNADTPLQFVDSRGTTTPVKSFGIRQRDMNKGIDTFREQVQVLFSDRSREESQEAEFAVDPCKHSPQVQMILARIRQHATLTAALTHTAERCRKQQPDRIWPGDTLLIPEIAVRVDHHFRGLEGKERQFLNPGMLDLHCGLAVQRIQFRLDKTGARVESSAELRADSKPGERLFHGPFLIVLKKRDAQNPFFVMWVDNAELLQKWGR